MRNLNSITGLVSSRKVAITTAAIITILVIIDLLLTRQILPYGTKSTDSIETIIFILTVVIGYGIGSWILLMYTKQISSELRAKSHLINTMHWTVMIAQFSLLGILLYVIYNNSVNCPNYFTFCNAPRFSTGSVDAISSVLASIILGIISFKFFSWYKLNKRNLIVLFYGLAGATLAISISGDAFDKLFLLQVVEEKTPPGAVTGSAFIYKDFEKYHGQVQYKVVNPHTTTIYVVPTSSLPLYHFFVLLSSDPPYVFTWLGTLMLLHYYYQRIGRVNLTFWIILSIPLILYLIGSGLIFSLPSDVTYRYFYRIIFRAGTVGSSVLFGLAFYITTRKLTAIKVKDYLTISAIGIIIVGIANEISELQPTYGVASHSLILLSSYLFSVGLYSAAVSVSQDNSLRKSVRESVGLLDNIGTAQMEQQIVRRVTRVVRDNQQQLEEQTGISSSTSEDDIRQYIVIVLEEKKKSIAKTIKTATTTAATTTKQTIEGLVTKLRSAGATVQTSMEKPSPNLYDSDKQEVILVNGETVQVFEYQEDEAGADVIAKRFVSESAVGSPDYVTSSRSHIYKAPKLVVRYLGDDLSITNLLESVLGKQVAERIIPTEKDMEDVSRLEKELEQREIKKHEVKEDVSLEKLEGEGTEEGRNLEEH
jgi:hypothetical protein